MTGNVLSVMVTAALIAPPAHGAASSDPVPSAERADWYLVDEIIEDESPDYRSEIYFADKASVERDKKAVTLAVSRIVMTGREDRSLRENIRDLRSDMIIDCSTGSYRMRNRSTYDGAEQPAAPYEQDSPQERVVPSTSETGYGAIVRFACDADATIGQRQSHPHMQPLTWLIAYINADWSK
ncbi:hypothetical protein SAMN02745824_2187 [Parasphingorhabdus marina DSM 22363]|uniref:Surface-adhesin protein E-like domain-containing protein n=1 Tax=Parasphingorhabdus marina DSM 22363 TaxID=1123272 RepID=A0A1N6F1F8_9SPHN|nr:surface-adhesin E family protein [Parasphingorhabdus marina]SIN89094.1 hypothetical protein SAMN02745824_2187 [Parasphingorhabdus marina DSM 22363]